jgi:hypothetical protein
MVESSLEEKFATHKKLLCTFPNVILIKVTFLIRSNFLLHMFL